MGGIENEGRKNMNEKSPPDPPTCLLPELCAEEVHKNILRCFRLGNRVTLKLLGWIKVLHDHNFAQTLSSRSTVQYIIDNLKYGQTEAYNLLNVALSIPGLPRTACAFEKGEISWSQVKPIAEIAKRGTEEAWISYARKNTVQALESKVKVALEEGEELPSDEEHGLPNIEVKMVFRLSRENQEIVRKALELSAAQLKESRRDGDTRVTHEEALVHLAKRGLKTDLFGPGSKASARERSIFDILFQVCPSCEESRMHTREGPVQVPREHVSQIEPEARKVEIGREELVKGEALTEGKIDGLEIPKDVQRKVLTRFGNACARCGRKNCVSYCHTSSGH
jgi:hypothetical protein